MNYDTYDAFLVNDNRTSNQRGHLKIGGREQQQRWLYQDEGAVLGTFTIQSSKPITVHLSQDCRRDRLETKRDFLTTYVLWFGPTSGSVEYYGLNWNKFIHFLPGRYEMTINNWCPNTTVQAQ